MGIISALVGMTEPSKRLLSMSNNPMLSMVICFKLLTDVSRNVSVPGIFALMFPWELLPSMRELIRFSAASEICFLY